MTQVRKRSRPTPSAGSARARAGSCSTPTPAPPPASPRHAAAAPGPLDRAINPELFKALCDPTRASITACLCKCCRPCKVSEIAECCRVDLSVVSRHLAMLERAGVLESSRRGREVLYRVRYDALIGAFRQLADTIEVCSLACGDHAPAGSACDCSDRCGPDCGTEPTPPTTKGATRKR